MLRELLATSLKFIHRSLTPHLPFLPWTDLVLPRENGASVPRRLTLDLRLT